MSAFFWEINLKHGERKGLSMETHEMLTNIDHGAQKMLYRQIALKGGAVVFANLAEVSRCKKCKQKIHWATTKNAKSMPICIDKDGNWVSHFSNCPAAKHFRVSAGDGDMLDEIKAQERREKLY